MSLFTDIFQSFRRLPLWVQIWMVLILIPINLTSLFFLDQPMGSWIAALAVFGMAFTSTRRTWR